VRERGFAIDDEEHAVGVRCVAAPIYSGPGRVVAAIGVSNRASETTPEELKEMGAMVLKPAADEAAKTPRILNALNRYYSISNNPKSDSS